jgi:hypothetical protein
VKGGWAEYLVLRLVAGRREVVVATVRTPTLPPLTTTTLQEFINGTLGFFGSRRWSGEFIRDD